MSLGIKQVEENPWLTFKEKYKTGDKYSGKVIKILDKGIIIELEDEIEGISLSRYPKNARWKIKKQFEIDQNIEDLVVQEVDIENKKIIFIAEFDDFEQSDNSVQNNVEINNEPVSEKCKFLMI